MGMQSCGGFYCIIIIIWMYYLVTTKKKNADNTGCNFIFKEERITPGPIVKLTLSK